MPPQFISVCTDGMGVTPAEPVARHAWMLIRSERALMAENAQQVPQYVGMCWRGEEAAAFEVLSRHRTQMVMAPAHLVLGRARERDRAVHAAPVPRGRQLAHILVGLRGGDYRRPRPGGDYDLAAVCCNPG